MNKKKKHETTTRKQKQRQYTTQSQQLVEMRSSKDRLNDSNEQEEIKNTLTTIENRKTIHNNKY